MTTSLTVNGAACGSVVAAGSTVCLLFTASQTGMAVVTIQRGTETATLFSESVTAGTTYSACTIAGVGNGVTRTITVTVSNTAGQSASQTCSYRVGAVR